MSESRSSSGCAAILASLSIPHPLLQALLAPSETYFPSGAAQVADKVDLDRLVAAGGERWRLDKMANRIAYVRQVRLEIAIMCIHMQKDE